MIYDDDSFKKILFCFVRHWTLDRDHFVKIHDAVKQKLASHMLEKTLVSITLTELLNVKRNDTIV